MLGLRFWALRPSAAYWCHLDGLAPFENRSIAVPRTVLAEVGRRVVGSCFHEKTFPERIMERSALLRLGFPPAQWSHARDRSEGMGGGSALAGAAATEHG